MNISIEAISPEMAKDYLSRNMINRKINEHRVRTYAEDMKAGEWQLNGEAIRFNRNGELIDGQHRLSAIVKAGIPVNMVVMKNISNDVSLFDRGRNRSELDSLQIEGMPKELANITSVSAARLHCFMTKKTGNVSMTYVKGFLNCNAEVIIAVNGVIKNKHKCTFESARINVDTAPIALAMYLGYAARISLLDIERFLCALKTGFYDSSNHESAAIVIRNDFLSNNIDRNGGTPVRELTCIAVQNALRDFTNGVDRKRSYKNSSKPVFNANLLSCERRIAT